MNGDGKWILAANQCLKGKKKKQFHEASNEKLLDKAKELVCYQFWPLALKMYKKNKFNLTQNYAEEDLMQEAFRVMIEGLENKWDPNRGSIVTFFWRYLDSRLGAINSKRKDAYDPRNLKNHNGIADPREHDDNVISKKVVLDNILLDRGELRSSADTDCEVREVFSSMSINKQQITYEHYVSEKPASYIAKKLGKGWSTNRVNMELKKIKKLFEPFV